jgi:2-keto-3-deoxy-L-rhamnonate aldolase RhmA
MMRDNPRLKAAVVDLSLLNEQTSLTALQAAAPSARLLVIAAAIPDAAERKRLLDQGVHQLLLAPVQPFELLEGLYRLCS